MRGRTKNKKLLRSAKWPYKMQQQRSRTVQISFRWLRKMPPEVDTNMASKCDSHYVNTRFPWKKLICLSLYSIYAVFPLENVFRLKLFIKPIEFPVFFSKINIFLVCSNMFLLLSKNFYAIMGILQQKCLGPELKADFSNKIVKPQKMENILTKNHKNASEKYLWIKLKCWNSIV